MTDLDVALIMGSAFLGMILWFIKSMVHFDYLKQEKGKFEKAESFTYIMLRPIYFFIYLPESFMIMNVPVLWNLRTNQRRLQMGILSYSAIILWTFSVLYVIFLK
jgi:hypothetical protein